MSKELLRIVEEARSAAADNNDLRVYELLGGIADAMRAVAEKCAEPVGRLTIEHFRSVKAMENVDFEYFGRLESGTYRVYVAPPSQPAVLPADLAAALAEMHTAMGTPATQGNIGDAPYVGVVKLAAKRLAEQPVALPDDAMVERLANWLRGNARMCIFAHDAEWDRGYARDILAAAFAAAPKPEVPHG